MYERAWPHFMLDLLFRIYWQTSFHWYMAYTRLSVWSVTFNLLHRRQHRFSFSIHKIELLKLQASKRGLSFCKLLTIKATYSSSTSSSFEKGYVHGQFCSQILCASKHKAAVWPSTRTKRENWFDWSNADKLQTLQDLYPRRVYMKLIGQEVGCHNFPALPGSSLTGAKQHETHCTLLTKETHRTYFCVVCRAVSLLACCGLFAKHHYWLELWSKVCSVLKRKSLFSFTKPIRHICKTNSGVPSLANLALVSGKESPYFES